MAFVTSQILGTNLATTASSSTGYSPFFKLGTEVNGSDGARYVYVKASAAVAANAFVKIDDPLFVAELTSTLSGAEPTRIGCAQVAIAANAFGWVVVKGPFTGLVAQSAAIDVKIYTSATAGVIRSVSSAGHDLIQGLKIATAGGTGTTARACYAANDMMTNSET